MKLVILENIEEIFNYFSSLKDDYIFRGQSDSNWDLVASLYRKDDVSIGNLLDLIQKESSGFELFVNRQINKSPQSAQYFQRIEMDFIRRFFINANKISLKIPSDAMSFISKYGKKHSAYCKEWPLRDSLELLAVMQHSGIPTSLLDWTLNPLVSIYFASEKNINEQNGYFSIWALSEDSLAIIKEHKELLIGSDRRYSKIIKYIEKINIYRGGADINKNLGAQTGCFTYIFHDDIMNCKCSDMELSLNRIVCGLISDNEEIEKDLMGKNGLIHDDLNNLLIKIDIPKKLSKELIILLRKFGVSNLTLFPNYAGCIQEMKMQRKAKIIDER